MKFTILNFGKNAPATEVKKKVTLSKIHLIVHILLLVPLNRKGKEEIVINTFDIRYEPTYPRLEHAQRHYRAT